MNGRPDVPGRGTGADLAAEAAGLLRRHTDEGWIAVRENVLHRALSAFRPSTPVRGRHRLGEFFVSADVVVAHLRMAVDGVPRTAAGRIVCTTGTEDRLQRVVVTLVVAYGEPLVPLAQTVHEAARAALLDLLGELAPQPASIHTHVHIGDVVDDPRRG